MKPGFWYLAGFGAAALTVEVLRRVIQGQRDAAVKGAFEPFPSTSVAATAPETAPAASSATVTSARSTPPNKATKTTIRHDDLTEIKGIGPVYALRLAETGITTFAALARMSPQLLREITRATAAADTEDWIAQARLR
jgi:large subunit ribosomal protein L21